MLEASIVIPTYNRRELLRRSLESLSEQTMSPSKYEVIICDDGSTDGTPEMVHNVQQNGLNVRYMTIRRSDGIGITRKRNAGIRKAAGRVIISADAGVLFHPEFVESHVSAHHDNPRSVVIGPIFGYDLTELPRYLLSWSDGELAGCINFEDTSLRDPREEVFQSLNDVIDQWCAPWYLAWTANVSWERTDLHYIGGFDEDLKYYGLEDIELAYRFYRSNFKFVLERHASVFHLPHERLSQQELEIQGAANKRAFYFKHPSTDVEILDTEPNSKGIERIIRYVRTLDRMDLNVHSLDYLADKIKERISETVLVGMWNPTNKYRPSLAILPTAPLVNKALQIGWNVRLGCGIQTDCDDKSFEFALVGAIPEGFFEGQVRSLLTEMLRISKVVLVCAESANKVPQSLFKAYEYDAGWLGVDKAD